MRDNINLKFVLTIIIFIVAGIYIFYNHQFNIYTVYCFIYAVIELLSITDYIFYFFVSLVFLFIVEYT